MRISDWSSDVCSSDLIEHPALEFGKLIQEQHAEMRETDLARPHTQPAADERGHRGRMMGAAERAGADGAATLKPARDRGDHPYLERLGRSEVGQAARHARAQQRLARPGLPPPPQFA